MLSFFDKEYPFPSRKNMQYAKNGMVATSQPLASEAGLQILRQGGNAIDAAIAMAACLTVVEPTSNGIGGDAFALVWIRNKLYGLNASGVSPAAISIDELQKRNIREIPRYGFIPVNVPGIPAAWAALSKRFGKLTLRACLEPAIQYARNGYPVSHTVSKNWKNAFQIYQKHLKGEEYQSWFNTFSVQNHAPEEGEIWSSSDLANTLESIGDTYSDAFYQGDIADKIDQFSRKYHGFISKTDLMNYRPLWVDPIHINYKGFDVWEIPPNGQGLVALEALKIIEGFDIAQSSESEITHLQIESMKLAFADGMSFISDPTVMPYSPEQFIEPEFIQKRKAMIKPYSSITTPFAPSGSGTVYLCTADKEGNMVSFIQSNYMGFGSGLVVPGTGISLQNRGHNFSMDPKHPNCLGPNKRPYHTIIPGFLTKEGKALGPFGVMGGFMQPQGHMQVVMNLIDLRLNPQSALDRPRWFWVEGKKVAVECSMSKAIVDSLIQKGHEIQVLDDSSSFGRGEIILVDENNILCGGSEPRCDASIACY